MRTITSTITVRLLCFAQLRRWLAAEASLMLPAASTTGDLLQRLQEHHPDAAPLLAVSRLAVNCEYVSGDHELHDGDEAALITRVSGG